MLTFENKLLQLGMFYNDQLSICNKFELVHPFAMYRFILKKEFNKIPHTIFYQRHVLLFFHCLLPSCVFLAMNSCVVINNLGIFQDK